MKLRRCRRARSLVSRSSPPPFPGYHPGILSEAPWPGCTHGIGHRLRGLPVPSDHRLAKAGKGLGSLEKLSLTPEAWPPPGRHTSQAAVSRETHRGRWETQGLCFTAVPVAGLPVRLGKNAVCVCLAQLKKTLDSQLPPL